MSSHGTKTFILTLSMGGLNGLDVAGGAIAGILGRGSDRPKEAISGK